MGSTVSLNSPFYMDHVRMSEILGEGHSATLRSVGFSDPLAPPVCIGVLLGSNGNGCEQAASLNTAETAMPPFLQFKVSFQRDNGIIAKPSLRGIAFGATSGGGMATLLGVGCGPKSGGDCHADSENASLRHRWPAGSSRRRGY